MRITKRQLKRIIKEEKHKLVVEQVSPEMLELQQSMADHILEMLYEEQMYSDLNLEDGAVVDAIVAAFRDAESRLRKNIPRAGVYS